jgi:hypothetical protein
MINYKLDLFLYFETIINDGLHRTDDFYSLFYKKSKLGLNLIFYLKIYYTSLIIY